MSYLIGFVIGFLGTDAFQYFYLKRRPVSLLLWDLIKSKIKK